MAMGYIKKRNLVSYIFLLCVLSILFENCNFEKKNLIKNKNVNLTINRNVQMQKFDIEKYESNLRRNPLYEGYQKDEDTFVKQFYTIKNGYIEKMYTKSLVQNYIEQYIRKDRFEDYYIYDKDGALQTVTHFFGNDLEIGKWLFYEDHKLIKTDDKDKNYPFNLDSVLSFGKRNKVDFTRSGKITRSKSSKYGFYVWDLTWNTGIKSPDGEKSIFKNVILDGASGKILFEEEYMVNPLSR